MDHTLNISTTAQDQLQKPESQSDLQHWAIRRKIQLHLYAGYGVAQNFPMPYVQTDPTQTNYDSVNQAINSCVALGGTNIGAAIDGAVKILSSSRTRTGSFKAIVLFTDGEPTATPSFPGPLDSDPYVNARKAAQEASDAGMPVYTIGLAQNSAIVPGETDILNDTNPDPNTGGIAAIAGHGRRIGGIHRRS